MDAAEAFSLTIEGHCPICETKATYQARGPWLRGSLICQSCPGGSVPRERAVALTLNRTRVNWRELAIHKSSPADRGISRKMRQEAPRYIASHYFADAPLGETVRGFRNENLEAQTFADHSLDIVITIDVFEHLFDPAAAFREIYRTLRPGGVCISTFPMNKGQVEAARWRARRLADGGIEHIAKPEYHGNPIDKDGSLVTVDYGYDVHTLIAEWTQFDVQLSRFADRSAGILGEFTDLIVCEKPRGAPMNETRSFVGHLLSSFFVSAR